MKRKCQNTLKDLNFFSKIWKNNNYDKIDVFRLHSLLCMAVWQFAEKFNEFSTNEYSITFITSVLEPIVLDIK